MIFGAEGGLQNKRQFDISEFKLCGTKCSTDSSCEEETEDNIVKKKSKTPKSSKYIH